MQLATALEAALGRELPPTLAFDYPTVASLVAFLTADSGDVAAPASSAEAAVALFDASPAPQGVRALSQQPLQPREAAGRQVAIMASSLQLPEAGAAGNELTFGADRSVFQFSTHAPFYLVDAVSVHCAAMMSML